MASFQPICSDAKLAELALYGRACNAGYMTVQRLIELLLLPFLAIAAKISQFALQPRPSQTAIEQEGRRDSLLDVWRMTVIGTLNGDRVLDKQGKMRCVR